MKRETKKRILTFNTEEGSFIEEQMDYPDLTKMLDGTIEYTRITWDNKKQTDICVVSNESFLERDDFVTTAFNTSEERVVLKGPIAFLKTNLRTGLTMNMSDEDIEAIKKYKRVGIINEHNNLSFAVILPIL